MHFCLQNAKNNDRFLFTPILSQLHLLKYIFISMKNIESYFHTKTKQEATQKDKNIEKIVNTKLD